MRRLGAFTLLVFVPLTAFAASRLTFERTVSASQNLGGITDLAITYAVGDNQSLDTFLDVFLEQTNRSGTLRVIDRTALDTPGPRRRRSPVLVQGPLRTAAFLRITSFTCRTEEHSGQVSSYDVDRNRVKRTLKWADAVCEAHIDAQARGTNKTLAEIDARGEGTSARVESLSAEDRAVAVDQAARYAAVVAADRITPRKVRESIELADDAPLFDEGMAYVDSDQLSEARRVWEEALVGSGTSGALHFNIAAVCEAMGDLDAAALHYDAALKLAPRDDRFRYAHDQFRRRFGHRH